MHSKAFTAGARRDVKEAGRIGRLSSSGSGGPFWNCTGVDALAQGFITPEGRGIHCILSQLTNRHVEVSSAHAFRQYGVSTPTGGALNPRNAIHLTQESVCISRNPVTASTSIPYPRHMLTLKPPDPPARSPTLPYSSPASSSPSPPSAPPSSPPTPSSDPPALRTQSYAIEPP